MCPCDPMYRDLCRLFRRYARSEVVDAAYETLQSFATPVTRRDRNSAWSQLVVSSDRRGLSGSGHSIFGTKPPLDVASPFLLEFGLSSANELPVDLMMYVRQQLMHLVNGCARYGAHAPVIAIDGPSGAGKSTAAKDCAPARHKLSRYGRDMPRTRI